MNAPPSQDNAVPGRRLVLIIGPIASGKSTLADALAGMLRRSGEAVVVVGLDVSVRKVLLTAKYETALARAASDPNRGRTKDPEFLRRMYQRFERTRADISHDLEFDTEAMSSNDLAQRVIEGLHKLP